MSKPRVAFGLNALAEHLGTSKQNLYQLVAKHQPPHSVEIQAGNKTIKGYGMGASGEGQNVAHQAKKMDVKSLKQLPLKITMLSSLRVIKLKLSITLQSY